MSTLKDKTIATTYDQIVKRADTYVQAGTNIEIMDDSGTMEPTGLYLEGDGDKFVGIGKSAPLATLAVDGGVNAVAPSSSITSNAMARFELTGQDLALDIGCTTSGTNRVWLQPRGDITDLSAANSINLTLCEQGGNVGIGATTVDNLLHLESSTAGASVLKIENTSGTFEEASDFLEILFSAKRSATTNDRGRIVVGRGGKAGSDSDSFMGFYTTVGSTLAERMRISKDGNVGIGTDNPGSELEIAKSDANCVAEISCWDDTAGNSGITLFQKSANTTIGSTSATADNERLGEIRAQGVNAVDATAVACSILFEGDATPANDSDDTVPGRIVFTTSSTTATAVSRMTIDKDGDIGIGVTDPDVKLEIKGNGTSSSTSTLKCTKSDDAICFLVKDDATIFMPGIASADGDRSVQYTDSTGLLTKHTSDRNLKKNIVDTDIVALSIINDIKIRNFEWKTNQDIEDEGEKYNFNYTDSSSGTKIGVIAQEVNEVIPEFCHLDDSDGLYGIDYSRFCAYLIKAVQELSAKVEALENA
jgi:hypothetical protein